MLAPSVANSGSTDSVGGRLATFGCFRTIAVPPRARVREPWHHRSRQSQVCNHPNRVTSQPISAGYCASRRSSARLGARMTTPSDVMTPTELAVEWDATSSAPKRWRRRLTLHRRCRGPHCCLRACRHAVAAAAGRVVPGVGYRHQRGDRVRPGSRRSMGVARVRQLSGKGPRRKAWRAFALSAPIALVVWIALGQWWQGQLRDLMGLPRQALRSCSFLSLRRLFSCSSSPPAEWLRPYIGE